MAAKTHGTLMRSTTLPATAFTETRESMTHGTLMRSTTLPATAFTDTRESMTTSTTLCRSTESTNDPPPGYSTSTITNLSEPPSRMAIDPTEKSDMLCDSPGQMVTPTLTHSPSSTESSSGDHTIHMASFIDEPRASSVLVDVSQFCKNDTRFHHLWLQFYSHLRIQCIHSVRKSTAMHIASHITSNQPQTRLEGLYSLNELASPSELPSSRRHIKYPLLWILYSSYTQLSNMLLVFFPCLFFTVFHYLLPLCMICRLSLCL
jgi:hypothetical protein